MLRNIKILLVEDSEDDAQLLGAMLARSECAPVMRRVDNAEEMCAALSSVAWDMVIADHLLPGFSAIAALNLLRESGSDIPFIIYSGHISDALATAAMNSGAQDFIQKGDYARLLPAIKRELKSVAARHAGKAAESRLARMEHYDDLTGLPNRQLFCQETQAVLSHLGRAHRSGMMAFIDLDLFKRINSGFGYAAGDQVLKQVAQRLRQSAGDAGSASQVSRLGHDEFGVFMPGIADSGAARHFLEPLMRVFAAPFKMGEHEFYVSVSMGVSLCPQDGSEPSRLLTHAEQAMFLAKRMGRNNYQFYDPHMETEVSRNLILETSLRHAVEKGELFLHFQPNVDMASGEILGSEALVRWNHPDLGVLYPDKFIALADETGLIVEIGEWVLEAACAQTRAWNDAGIKDISIAVNVSAVQFRQPGLIEKVAAILDKVGLPPGCLELEITETVLMRDVEATIATLQTLREMGVKISIDDFGTGYSSLNYLRRFPLDILKIDRSFVRDMTLDPNNLAIVRAITTLGKSLKLTIVAEGVETEEQFQMLRHERCERMQGYLFSRPVEAGAFWNLMTAQHRLAA